MTPIVLARRTLRFLFVVVLATASQALAGGTITIVEGGVIKTTREAVLNGVTLPKGTELRIAGVKKDESGNVTRVDLLEVGGEKKLFKAITTDSLFALVASAASAAPSDDRSSVFKVAAQIPIVHDLSLSGM